MIPVWPGWRWIVREMLRDVLGIRHRQEVRALIERTKKLLSETDADRARRSGL